jgi:hypothetical protein
MPISAVSRMIVALMARAFRVGEKGHAGSVLAGVGRAGMSPKMARGCRLARCSKVGRYLWYTGSDGSLLGKAALDPKRKLQMEERIATVESYRHSLFDLDREARV